MNIGTTNPGPEDQTSAKPTPSSRYERDGRFIPGGKPGPGIPKGFKYKRRNQALIDLKKRHQEIVDAVVATAKKGDTIAQKLCLERIIPTITEQQRQELGGLQLQDMAAFMALVIATLVEIGIEQPKLVLLREKIIEKVPALLAAEEEDQEPTIEVTGTHVG